MANTYTLISSNVLSSSAASVTFSAIPATYTDLVLRVSIRADHATRSTIYGVRLNSATTDYSSTYLLKTESGTAFSSRETIGGLTFSYMGVAAAANATANTFNSAELYIPNYTATAKKPASVFGAFENNSVNESEIIGGAQLFSATTAITSITILPFLTGNFISGSSFYLYGIKNS